MVILIQIKWVRVDITEQLKHLIISYELVNISFKNTV